MGFKEKTIEKQKIKNNNNRGKIRSPNTGWAERIKRWIYAHHKLCVFGYRSHVFQISFLLWLVFFLCYARTLFFGIVKVWHCRSEVMDIHLLGVLVSTTFQNDARMCARGPIQLRSHFYLFLLIKEEKEDKTKL